MILDSAAGPGHLSPSLAQAQRGALLYFLSHPSATPPHYTQSATLYMVAKLRMSMVQSLIVGPFLDFYFCGTSLSSIVSALLSQSLSVPLPVNTH